MNGTKIIVERRSPGSSEWGECDTCGVFYTPGAAEMMVQTGTACFNCGDPDGPSRWHHALPPWVEAFETYATEETERALRRKGVLA